jgi:hypothetical protein
MLSILLAAVLASTGPLPDPAACTVVVAECPTGLLLTDGRDCGLYLLNDDGSLTVLSLEPGAGRNVVVTGETVFFKECPADEEQRVSLWSAGEGTQALCSPGDFCGPFESPGGGFLTIESHELVLRSLVGVRQNSWNIGEGASWAAASGGSVWLSYADGGLRELCMESGMLREVPEASGRCWSRVEPGPEGMVLAACADEGFIVLDNQGAVLLDIAGDVFPKWTPDGRIVCSVLGHDGPVASGGRLELLDPLGGGIDARPAQGVPIHPLMLQSREILFTDVSDGSIAGRPGIVLPVRSPGGSLDEPEIHFDVPYIHQRWDTPDWFNGSWSCGPTSCMMATQFYRMLPPDSIWASSPSPGHWSPWGNYIPVEYTFLGHTYDILGEAAGGEWVPGAHGFICREYGGAVWNYMVSFLDQHAMESAWAGQAWSTLTGQLDQGYPVVCSSTVLGSGHIILFNGYYSNHTVIVNDPYGDANAGGWGSYYNGKDVLYDWPGYNNGHVEIGVSQLFYARAAIPAEPDTLVDDSSLGFEKLGNCQYWHLTGTGYGGNAWWTYSTGAPPDTCIGRWNPALPGTGDYEVSVYIPSTHAEATGIYRIETVSGTVEVSLDQGSYSGEWASLGTFTMGDGDRLLLGDFTGSQGEHIAFDAAVFSPAGTGISGSSAPASSAWLTVSPNPCSGSAVVCGQSLGCGGSITVYDLCGRIVLTTVSSGYGTVPLDLSGLMPGIYVLKALDPTGQPGATASVTVLGR